MDPLLRLEDMLSEFSPLFKHNNFDHRTFVKGLINTPHLTQVYLSTDSSTTYWCLPKFLSRGVWCVDKVRVSLMRQVRNVYSEGVYVYDESHAVNNGGKQYGTHFFRNTRYQKRNKNESKFHHGHEFGALGWLCETVEGVRLFPLGTRVMCPGKKRDSSFAVLKRLCAKMSRSHRF